MASNPAARALRFDIAAWAIAAVLLVFILVFHLLPALLGGLLVYELVRVIAPRLKLARRGKVAAVALLAVVIVALLALMLFGALAFFRSGVGDLPALLQKMADIVDNARGKLPAWALDSLPADADALKAAVTDWLREHAQDLRTVGGEFGRVMVHILVGMIIGAMVSLHEAREAQARGALADALAERITRLGNAFRRVVFAQVRIAALNTVFTAAYLVVLLPILGVHLPFAKTLVAITFFAGLVPVLGNLISNTVIVIVSLSVSLYVALGSLVFLVVIHKLEYFLNARIVGTQIRASAWELLAAMLAMEAAFGIPGVVAAPIYYAYLKDELAARGLV